MGAKILALYLPQFHETSENNIWWGEGFTEWNVVKAAKKINKHTIQPRVPLDGYYDLSNKDSIRHQAELARKYGVDGFVIYSYYSNGEKLLYKPAELLLNDKSIDIEYCFSWANHDWMRTWFSYNKEMLRKQLYAETKQQISDQFNYYLPYFKDHRYIKIAGKPVLFIYDPESIPNFKMYRECFNELAIEAGLNGIYLVQTLGGHRLQKNKEDFDAFFEYEPTYTTFSQMHAQHFVNRIRRGIKKITHSSALVNYFDYNKVCNAMESRNDHDKSSVLGSFAEWDNTPRHSHNGTVFKNFTIERFEKNVFVQLRKANEVQAPFIVIDAWNEWGEGAFLEPDEEYQLQKLNAIKSVKLSIR